MLGFASPVEPLTMKGRRRPGRGTAVRLLLALVFVASLLAGPIPAGAESPSPTILGGGDPRSEGEGAGLVGAPFLVALGVIALGVAASGVTLLFVRLRREE